MTKSMQSMFFSIPEYNYLYCTDIMKDEIEKLSNLGFTFLEIFDDQQEEFICKFHIKLC